MYKVFCDGQLMYDPRSKDLSLIEPTLELALNSAGSFSFSMPQKHPFYDEITNMKSVISVERDGIEIFSGRVIQPSSNFYNVKTFVCEGELAFLNDSIQRHKEYHNISVENYLKDVISIHNAQVEDAKKFTVGNVTVYDSNDSIYKISNYENTWQLLNDKLLETFGGYLLIRKANGVRYLDYLAELPGTCSQEIKFGRNLLDFSSNIELTDIATALIPLGSEDEETGEKLTVASVNGGSDVIVSEEAVETYGYICKTNEWSDVTLASNLLTKGQEYLSNIQWENMLLNVKAVDLHDLDANIEKISIGDKIKVISIPHGLNRFFPVSALSIKLDNPADNSISLGIEVSANKQTTQMADIGKAVKSVQEDVEEINETIGQTESRLETTEDGLEAEVSRAISAEEIINASLALKIGEDDTGKLISMLEAIADNISFTANKKFTIDSDNFSVDEDGKMECSSAEITGGSVNIATNGADEDKIQLKYLPDSSYVDKYELIMSPSTFTMEKWLPNTPPGVLPPANFGYYAEYTDGNFSMGTFAYGSTRNDANIILDAETGEITADGYNGDFKGNLSGTAGSVHIGNKGLIPSKDNSINLGGIDGTKYRFATVYAGTGEINTSDRNEKKNITELTDQHLELFERLVPVSFQFIDGTSGRTHIGFISQDVEDAMNEVGLSDLDFAGFCKDEITDEDGNVKYVYGLRYSEFIALNTMMIQKTRNELSNLKGILQKKGVI